MESSPRGRGWRTVAEILSSCAQHRPDVVLMVEPDGTGVTAALLLDRALRGARFLRERGVDRGDFVAVDTTTLGWSEVAACYFSVVWLGAVAVMTLSETTERAALGGIGVQGVIAGNDMPRPGVWGCAPRDLLAATPWDQPSPAQPDDRLDLVFTSGTTGEPKPVESRHSQWTVAVHPDLVRSRSRRVVAHSGVPVAVSGGLHGILLNHVARGVTSLCGRTAGDLVRLCAGRQVHELHLTPYAARATLRHLADPQPWTRSVKIIRMVGGPVPPTVAEQLSEAFPQARVISLYGLTEGGAAAFVKVVDGRSPGSIGRPVVGTQARIVDSAGRELAAGEVGEVAVRATGATTLSYYGEDALTQTWFPDGWARTGDLGYLDGSGAVRLVGRVKEMIFLKGGRISPDALEELFAREIPDAVEFAVAGVPTSQLWDGIAVFLCGREDSPPVVEARRRLAEMTGPFRPHLVRVVDTIPRGPSGKALRARLTQELVTRAQ